ncbi:MAG TPA: cytochrome c biogenesis protein ResB [Dehalococcoidia bacterium]|nr:cytochrome c biogenesis protein ResB [Dehalococcoidia bacterium]
MAEESALRGAGWWRLARELDPIRATWRLFTNVRWAIGIIAFLALASLVGVVVPQVPAAVRGDAVAEGRWLDVQEGRFGFLTGGMNSLGLFDVFHAGWFIYALGLLVVSVAVCTAGRLPPVWRSVNRPAKRVNDAYFQSARYRLEYGTPAEGSRLESVLRRRLYAVERYEEGDTVYLFADRFQLAQLATFASHLALIVILAAALVSRFSGFSNGMMIAEGESGPVFPLKNPRQMQVQLLDAVGRFTPDGQPLEYSSRLAIYDGGEEAKRCTSTVNTPCSYRGYRFHQAAYFGFGADVQVRNLASGNVVFRETLALASTLPSPHVIVRDGAGTVLLDGTLVLTDILSDDQFTYYGRLVTLPGGRTLTIGARKAAAQEEWRLAAFEPGERGDAVRLVLSEGESAAAGGLAVEFADLQAVPAEFIPDFPLPPDSATGGGSQSVLLEMSNVVYGTETTSEGTAVRPAADSGPPELTIVGVRPQALTLRPGEKAEVGGYEYSFVGQREFAGIQVKRDRSDYLVWLGVGLLLAGLLATFWVPRRRLWAKISPARTQLAGHAGHLVNFEKEMAEMARDEGGTVGEQQGQENDE